MIRISSINAFFPLPFTINICWCCILFVHMWKSTHYEKGYGKKRNNNAQYNKISMCMCGCVYACVVATFSTCWLTSWQMVAALLLPIPVTTCAKWFKCHNKMEHTCHAHSHRHTQTNTHYSSQCRPRQEQWQAVWASSLASNCLRQAIIIRSCQSLTMSVP